MAETVKHEASAGLKDKVRVEQADAFLWDVIDSLRRRPALLGAFLVVATLLLYLPVAHHAFLKGWDDDIYISDNVHVRSGLTLANVVWAFTTLKLFYWQPLTLLSHMAVCQLFGLSSGAHHYVNVFLHAANVLLLFVLLRRGTGEVWRSFVVSALFALHPMNVQTVAWTAERNGLLNTFFSLLTIAAYGWFALRPGWRRYLAVIAAFLLALMSKPMAVTIPLILLFVDYWPLNRFENLPFARRWGRLILEKLPMIAIAGGVSALTVIGENSSYTVPSFSVLPMSVRLGNAVVSYAAYIGTMLWPARVSPFYPHPFLTMGISPAFGEVAASTLLLAGVTAFVFLHGARYARMGWLFFLLTLVPVIGIVQTGVHSREDHHNYIPCIGLLVLLVWGMGSLIERAPTKRTVFLVASICLLSGYAMVTANYLQYWKDSVSLSGRAQSVAAQPNQWLEQVYGNALSNAGRVDEALQHYEESCALRPQNPYCHYEIANIFSARRQFRDALKEYQLALTLHPAPDFELACLDKSAQIQLQLGEYDEADASVADALQLDPNDATALSLRRQLSVSRK